MLHVLLGSSIHWTCSCVQVSVGSFHADLAQQGTTGDHACRPIWYSQALCVLMLVCASDYNFVFETSTTSTVGYVVLHLPQAAKTWLALCQKCRLCSVSNPADMHAVAIKHVLSALRDRQL